MTLTPDQIAKLQSAAEAATKFDPPIFWSESNAPGHAEWAEHYANVHPSTVLSLLSTLREKEEENKFLIENLQASYFSAVCCYIAAVKGGDLDRASHIQFSQVSATQGLLETITNGGDFYDGQRCIECGKILQEGEPVHCEEGGGEICCDCIPAETPYVHSKIDHGHDYERAKKMMRDFADEAEEIYIQADEQSNVMLDEKDAQLTALREENERLEKVFELAEKADRRIAWESMGFGNTFAEEIDEAIMAVQRARKALEAHND